MSKLGYDSIPMLSVLFEKYADKTGVSAWENAADFMFTVCQFDKQEGSNKQSMSIEKLLNAGDEIWQDFVTEKLGMETFHNDVSLPRVQKERLYLDYLLWMIYAVIKGGKMPCYCCESTPRAIDRATEASYKSEDELGEVFEMLYNELQSVNTFEPSEAAVNMLESTAYMVKVLKDLQGKSKYTSGYDVDSWAATLFRRDANGEFKKCKMLLPNSLLDAHTSLRLLGEFVPDIEFFRDAKELRDTNNFEVYARQCMSSVLHHAVRFAYTAVQSAYSDNEYSANYTMNCLLTNFNPYLPVGTLSLDNVAPSVNPPSRMHTVARNKCRLVFSSGNDMCSTQSIIALFGVMFMFGLNKGNTSVTPEQIKETLGIDKFTFWRW